MNPKTPTTPLERIKQRRVITETGCWESDFSRRAGYPTIKINGRKITVHRFIYEALIGPIPNDLWVLHRCDNPNCHNPAHLFLGTPADNYRDMVKKKRHRYDSTKIQDHEQILAFARSNPSLQQFKIAERFGCSPSLVSTILRANNIGRGRGSATKKNPLAGTKHPNSLFAEPQIRAIRSDSRSARLIAAEYNCSVSTIHAIRNRQNWSHVA